MTGQNAEFTKIGDGYDPGEVDAAVARLRERNDTLNQRNDSLNQRIDELNRQNDELSRQKDALTETMAVYDGRLQKLAESTKRLEDERIEESLRITGLVNVASYLARQIKEDAQREADKIIEDAKRRAAPEPDAEPDES